MALARADVNQFSQDTSNARDDVIIEYLPYVKRMVSRIAAHLPPSVDTEDLIHAGVIGLIQAYDRFDPSRENQFMTYARFRIRGAILSELRSRDFLSRSMRRKLREVDETYARLEQKLDGEVDDEAVAHEMSISIEELQQIRARGSICFVSFEELGINGHDQRAHVSKHLATHHSDEDVLEMTGLKEIGKAITANIDRLPEKEQMVLSLYYVDELTMKEIGKVLNITESRVSQIHSRAIIRLRGVLRRQGFLDD